jgi:hypothetical protein
MNFLRRLFGSPRSPGTPQERQRLDHRAETLPAGYKRLIQGQPLEVHGESHHRAEIEAAVGRRPEGHQDIVDAMLVLEPDNQWDPNAIAVQVAGRTCGYVPKLDAKRYRPVMEWARAQGFVPVVRADVTGGWQLPDGAWADFGIRLYLASPNKILGQPEPPPPVPSREHPWAGQVIAFTGDNRCVIAGERLDRARSEELARVAGMEVHERVTKKVQLLIDRDDQTVSGNQRKAIEYGIPVVHEAEFWAALGLTVETI